MHTQARSMLNSSVKVNIFVTSHILSSFAALRKVEKIGLPRKKCYITLTNKDTLLIDVSANR